VREVFVAGAASTPFGKYLDRPLRSLAEEAVGDALADAGASPGDVEAAYFANAAAGVLTGQEMIRGQTALRATGLLGIPLVNVENACASGSSAFHLAWLAVASGWVEVAMAVGAEKLTHVDKSKTFGAFDGAVDLNERDAGAGEEARSRSRFMDLYAGMARDYMARSDAALEDFARVAVKSHANAAGNPKAQYRNPITIDDVLASRTISDPLTLLMCSPIGDGAAALVLASERGLRLHAGPVRVLAAVVLSATDEDDPANGVVTRAATRAYSDAGIAPADVDVVELHDAAAPAELIVSEELGIAAQGHGPELLRSGATSVGGRIPINPSGGLLAKGHPIGATGCSQIVEIVDQLRGRCGARQVGDARIGLAENAGGWLGSGPAVATITILGTSRA
jgi:acetyl-CoA acyltransferase